MAGPVDDPLTLLQASCHGPTLDVQTIRFALSSWVGAHVVNFSEAYRHRLFLAERESWRSTMPETQLDDDRDTIRGKFDAPVMVRRRLPMVDEWSRLMCHRAVPLRLAPPRYGNGQAFVHPLGLIEDTTLHPHAAVEGFSSGLPRVQEYARGMDRLERRIARALDDNRLAIGSGDLNYSDHDGPEFAPRRMFARLGLRTWNVGVDWVWWSPELVCVARDVFTREQTRQDHPWLRARFSGFLRGGGIV